MLIITVSGSERGKACWYNLLRKSWNSYRSKMLIKKFKYSKKENCWRIVKNKIVSINKWKFKIRVTSIRRINWVKSNLYERKNTTNISKKQGYWKR